MMEKDPSERIQTSREVAERLAPWAADDSPLMNDEMSRQRWMPAPVNAIDDQDTDPSDIAELAMSEITDASASNLQGTSALNDAGMDTGSFSSPGKYPPTPFATVSGQYKSAGRLPQDGPSVSITNVFMIGVACLVIGILLGFFLGYVFPKV